MRKEIAAVLILAGCAPTEGYNIYGQYVKNYTAANIQEAPAGTLCEYQLHGPYADYVDAEIHRRNLDCGPVLKALAAERQQQQTTSQSLLNAGAQFQALQARQRAVAPTYTTCSSMGGFVNCATR